VGDPGDPENLGVVNFAFARHSISLSETDTTMASLSDITVETTTSAQEGVTQDSEAIVKVFGQWLIH